MRFHPNGDAKDADYGEDHNRERVEAHRDLLREFTCSVCKGVADAAVLCGFRPCCGKRHVCECVTCRDCGERFDAETVPEHACEGVA